MISQFYCSLVSFSRFFFVLVYYSFRYRYRSVNVSDSGNGCLKISFLVYNFFGKFRRKFFSAGISEA